MERRVGASWGSQSGGPSVRDLDIERAEKFMPRQPAQPLERFTSWATLPSFSPHSSHVYFCLLGASHTLEVLRRGGDGAPSQTSALASLPRQGTVQSLTKFEQSGGLPTRLPPPSSADASPDQIPSGRLGSGRALSGGLGSGRSPAAARCGTCKVAPTVRASVRKAADTVLVPLTDCTEGVGLGLNRLALGAGLGAGLG